MLPTSRRRGVLTVPLPPRAAGLTSSLGLSAATAQFIYEVAGAKGSQELTNANGTTLTAIASAINTSRDVTGVSAVASGRFLELKSTDFGSDQFDEIGIEAPEE